MASSQVPGGGGRPRPFHSIGRVPEDRSGQGNVCMIERKKYESTHGIKFDLDAANCVGRADGYHAEQAVSPASEHGDAPAEHEEILQVFDHPG